MEAVVAGLIVAAVGGLAWFAYNHPAQFIPLSISLMVIWIGGGCLVIAWSMGVMWTKVEAVSFISENDWPKFERAADGLKFDLMSLWIVMCAVQAYLSFLYFVVTKLKDSQNR